MFRFPADEFSNNQLKTKVKQHKTLSPIKKKKNWHDVAGPPNAVKRVLHLNVRLHVIRTIPQIVYSKLVNIFQKAFTLLNFKTEEDLKCVRNVEDKSIIMIG